MKISTICFLIKDNRVLLAEKKMNFGKGFLNGYGGKVEAGETTESAAVRELHEEAGVMTNVSDIQKVAVIDFFDGNQQIFECHVFFASKWQGDPIESDEMAMPQWFDMDNVPYARMWKADREWLPYIFSGKKIYGKAYYKTGMKEFERFEQLPLKT